MPSFDITCELDHHELSNAVDQANREVSTRFDFKGSDAKFDLNEKTIVLTAEADFQLKQMMDVLKSKMVKRDVDLKHLDPKDPIVHHKKAEQTVELKEGIPTDIAKKITKAIKEEKFKVQASIQGEQVRVTGKKRDDLQSVMAFIKDQKLELPLNFGNFRD